MNHGEIEQNIYEMEERGFFSPDDYSQISQWAKSPDVYIRDMVASLLAVQPDDQSKAILLHLACDEDALVRADAYDSLSAFPCPDVLDRLKDAVVTEPDSLARSYAILSCADLALAGPETQTCMESFFHTILEQEKSSRCKLCCQYALFLYGDECAIDHILEYLNHSDYRVRCTAISILQEIANVHNISKIQYALCTQRKVESSVAVRDKIDEFLEFSKQLV